jgi:hypothetical protein
MPELLIMTMMVYLSDAETENESNSTGKNFFHQKLVLILVMSFVSLKLM